MGSTGLAVVDKPAGVTSHDVVVRLRRLAGTRRVGHGGTLDPMATGVLVLAIGRATRLLGYVIGSDKGYRATVRLGQSTTTDDAEGEVIDAAAASAAAVTEQRIRLGLAALTGDIDQVPSTVSAIKVQGRRAYARVRAGEEVVLQPRRVRVSRLDLLAIRTPRPDLRDCDIEVECSSGTYVRALARDLGQALGVGGHLVALRRTRVGVFSIDEAVSLAELEARHTATTLPVDEAVLRFFARRDVDEPAARLLSHGNPLPAIGLEGPYAIFGPDGRVLAIVRERDGMARPEVVLSPGEHDQG